MPDAADSAPDPAADFAPDPDGGQADRYLRDSAEADRLYRLAVEQAEAGDEAHAAPYFLRAAKYAEAAREWYLAAVSCHRAGDIFRSEEPPFDLDRAFRLYRRGAAAYGQCGHTTEARLLAYDSMHLRLRHGRALGLSRFERTELFLFWLVAGFGYRPLRVLAAAFAVVFGFAVLFWATDGVEPARAGEAVTFLDCFYFSGITFSTVGYGDLLPARHVRYWAMLEGATGAFAMSFFVVVLANRLRH